MDNAFYGYWISHKGELIPVNKFKHYDIADQYVLKHHYKEYFDYVTQEDDDRYDPPSSATFLFDRLGWIRIVQEGRVLNAEISPNSLTLPAYRAFVKFVNDNLFEYYNVDVKGKHHTHLKGYNYSEDVQGKRYKDKLFTMMKSNVDVSKVVASVKKPTILRNPPLQKLLSLLNNAQYKELKGLIVGKDVYWWNQVENWHHGQMAIKLGLGTNIPGKGVDKPYIHIDTFDNMRLTLMYEIDQDDQDRLVLVNAAQEFDSILKVKYLKNLIVEGDFWLDGHSPESKFNFISGRNYINGGVMTKASYIRTRVHASVRANEAKERLDLYKRLKNDKKV